MSLPRELLERVARLTGDSVEAVAARSVVEARAAGLSSSSPPPPVASILEGPAADACDTKTIAKERGRGRWRRRIVRRQTDVQRRAELRARWAELAGRKVEDVPLPRGLPFEVRGWSLGLVQDITPEHRRAVEACVWRLPAPQGRALLAVRAEHGEHWPRLVAAALSQWRLARRARRGARCWRIVDGFPREAYLAPVLKPNGRQYSMSTLWGGTKAKKLGPFLELERIGLYGRRQPRADVATYVGPKKCGRCRRVLASCACATGPDRVIQFALGQTAYQRDMCGKSIASLARHDRRARAELARHAPWLVRASEKAAEAAEELSERPPVPDAPEAPSAAPAAPESAGAVIGEATGPPPE